MKVVIITAVIGNREILNDPPTVHNDCEYVAFVDKNYENIKIWRQIIVGNYTENIIYKDRINSKLYKVLPEVFLPGYDYYAWVDAAHAYKISPIKLIKKNKEFHYLAYKHSKRKSILSELFVVTILGYDKFINLYKFFKSYKRSNYSPKTGLFELTAFIKRSEDRTKLASVSWFEYIIKYSSRDQLSFPIIVSNHNLVVKNLEGEINSGKLFGNSDVIQYKNHTSSGSENEYSIFRKILIKIFFILKIIK